MHVDGADAVHEAEALSHILEGLGAGPGEEDGIVMEIQGDLGDVGVPDIALDLAGCIAAGDEDIVADLHVTLAHEGADTVVAAVDEDAVGDTHIAFHIHVEAVFVTVGEADLGAVGGSVGLHETAGQHSVVGGSGDLVGGVGDAIDIVLTEVEDQSVDHDSAHGAGVAVRPPGVEIEQGRGEFLVGGLELGHMLDDVPLGEIGGITAVDADELAGLVGGVTEASALDVAAVQVAQVITLGHEDDVIVLRRVDGFLQIPHGSGGRQAVSTGRAGAGADIESLPCCSGCS